jgi:hypothetical protein
MPLLKVGHHISEVISMIANLLIWGGRILIGFGATGIVVKTLTVLGIIAQR